VCNLLKITAIISIAFLLTSCGGGGGRSHHYTKSSTSAKIEEVSFEDLPNWKRDRHTAAVETFQKSCEKFLSNDPENLTRNASVIGGTIIDWQVPCMEANHKNYKDDDEARRFFERWFVPYRLMEGDFNQVGTLTGYYEIELKGSKYPTDKYRWPVHAKPRNLKHVRGTSDIEHGAINDGALEGRGLEIAWVENRPRLYQMHVQGSGVIKLPDGEYMRVGFDGSNGHSFRGINEAVRSYNVSFKSTKHRMDWLHKNPEICLEILSSDPSYVFFREVNAEGAIGGQGVPLTTERSMAVDPNFYPYGAPIWVDAELPKSQAYRGGRYSRLFIAQDAGGAIKGPLRGDVFFGNGDRAEVVANHFKTRGEFFVLLPRTLKVPKCKNARIILLHIDINIYSIQEMKLTRKVQKILANYESDNPGTKANLARILMNGKLGGTGKLVILPVDQGFEHGPGKSFQKNPDAYDPHYHFSIAIEAGLSAYAAPLGMLEAGADTYAGSIPMILKVNSSNSMLPKAQPPHQAITSSVQDALRLGCSAIGFTIYPGAENSLDMMEQIREMAEEAKHFGLAVVIWAYPRGGDLSKEG